MIEALLQAATPTGAGWAAFVEAGVRLGIPLVLAALGAVGWLLRTRLPYPRRRRR